MVNDVELDLDTSTVIKRLIKEITSQLPSCNSDISNNIVLMLHESVIAEIYSSFRVDIVQYRHEHWQIADLKSVFPSLLVRVPYKEILIFRAP